MFRYRMFIEWSDADGCYVALAPAFPGCAGGGRTPQAAVKELVASCEAALEVARERGEVPPEDICQDYSGNIRLRIPKHIHRRLALEAEASGVSLNQTMLAYLASSRLASEPPRTVKKGAAKKRARK